MFSKVKVGVFGARRGMSMIEILAQYPDAELVAVCDWDAPSLENCRKLAEKTGIDVALYDNVDKFFEHDMDAVVLANYATEHAPYAVKFLKSGRHVLSEVLPVQTLSQAVELVEAYEESKCVYAFAENYCYFTTTFEMGRRYRNGDIGELMHAEGEYIHDASSIWPQITYGERDHWRNRLYSTYYSSHSLGPIVYITGLKPKRVVGFENQCAEYMLQYGKRCGCSGLVIVQMENDATVKSVNGNLKREPSLHYYSVYGTRGMMETDRWNEAVLHKYIEGERTCHGDLQNYEPGDYVSNKQAKAVASHGGSDFYPIYFFIEKILGREDGTHSIDLYSALDMGLPGILAYRSILNGNAPVEYPDFRDKNIRDSYRGDTACTDPAVAGDQLIPTYSRGEIAIDDSVYEKVRNLWLNGISG